MKFSRSKDSRTAGFSLLELIVVIAIITLLAGILTPLVKNSLDDAKIAKVVSLVDSVKKAAMKYYYDTTVLPTSDDLIVKPAAVSASAWKGPYIDAPITSNNPFGASSGMVLSSTPTGDTTAAGGSSDGFLNMGGIAANDVTGAGNGCQLLIPGVPIDTAKALELAIDGTAWVSGAGGTGMVEFNDAAASGSSVDVYIFLFKK